jgi:DNA-binding transcriptional MerR regulator
LWCIKDIARFYRCHRSTVHRWDAEGVLPPPVKDYGHRRWNAAEVIRALSIKKGKVVPLAHIS